MQVDLCSHAMVVNDSNRINVVSDNEGALVGRDSWNV